MQPFASQNPLTPQPDSQQPPSLPAVPVPQSVASAQTAQPPQPASNLPAAAQGTPELADDGDLIEKEWVSQVKHIMHATAHDPYEQSKQFSSLRADYMQKRYGKVIKAED